jgi:putative membrane-bound dehydrogenase-like protein
MRLSTHLRYLLILFSSLIPHPSSLLLAAEEPPVVAPTDALSAADERRGFTVPPGFDVQLVASEPDIQKPIQMAFDAKGRLWVTTSRHYPFAAPAGVKPTDKLFVLSDFDPATGKARKVQVFADDLNIPIGILPMPDCQSCIVSSAGEIRKYSDTKGTGKADKMEVLFSSFGYRDTHGMYNSYTFMPDGWVYACHGYLNTSKVKGKDGHEVEMNSGNTFRFRPDGSRIEVYTRGQVNPFGIAIDPWFNLYTADCHSKPITQLIPGGYYDSFGKPHDGLGYAPHVTNHDHGSTALCGLSWYDADHFPKEYKGTMFLGNVVTNRINFDRIEWKGATPVGVEQPDFLVSNDPWFRPVDIKLGPDGALYVSDFYNKIIGHYEVDLRDPRRDKDRGRVWRIVWKGKDGMAPAPKIPYTDLTTEKLDDVGKLIANPNMTVRLQATHEIISRLPKKDVQLGKVIPETVWTNSIAAVAMTNSNAARLFPWIMYRTGMLDEPGAAMLWPYAMIQGTKGAAGDLSEPALWIRTLSARKELSAEDQKMFSKWLATLAEFKSLPVRKTGTTGIDHISEMTQIMVDVAIVHPHRDNVEPLIKILKKCPAEDTHLRQATRIALRNCLRDDEKAWPPFTDEKALAKGFDPIYTEMAVAIPNRMSAQYLVALLAADKLPQDRIPAAAEHIARYGDIDELTGGIEWLTSVKYTPAIGDGLVGYLRALQTRGKQLDDKQRKWVLDAVDMELASLPPSNESFHPNDEARLISIARVLAALPALMTPWNEGNLKTQTVKNLGELLQRSMSPIELRVAAADALQRATPHQGLPALRQVFADTTIPPALRERLLVVMAGSAIKEARLDARDSLKDAPYRIALTIGTALAGTPAGADDLLDAVKQGKAPARLLQERVILERLRAAKVPNLDKQIGDLTKGLPALDKRLAELMKQRATSYASAKTDKELGVKLFAKHCGACHRIADQGGKIAPQLDGIGVRGLERLLEDVLDPNRNVDQAFRARVITTKDDRTITGLMLRVEGEVLIVADGEGKEVRIPTKDIAQNRETMLSPMPANFGDVIPEADFHHLMAYLLDQKAKDPPKK